MLQEVPAIFIASTKCFCCIHQTSASPHSFFTLWELLCSVLLPSCLPQGCKVSPKANGRALNYHFKRGLWRNLSYKHLTYPKMPPLPKLALKFDEMFCSWRCLPAKGGFAVLFSCLFVSCLAGVEVCEVPWVSDIFRLQWGFSQALAIRQGQQVGGRLSFRYFERSCCL